MKEIRIEGICKRYHNKTVLKDFSATLPAGVVTGMMAPSGTGKTTLLRILMGLEQPDSGHIEGLPDLRISAVFQEDRLCENLTPTTNIRLVNPKHTTEEVQTALSGVGLSGCLNQPVRELSGGMRRRVAILRALMAEYELLLLDEPFKGLDAQTKRLVMEDTRRRCAGRTVLLVTHDAEELDALGAVVRLELNTVACT